MGRQACVEVLCGQIRIDTTREMPISRSRLTKREPGLFVKVLFGRFLFVHSKVIPFDAGRRLGCQASERRSVKLHSDLRSVARHA